jgi:Mn2+/Fe2+ NRAMP family transporter
VKTDSDLIAGRLGPDGASPGTRPTLRERIAALGPGMIMAATAIGTSHIVLAPVAGARYGFALLWILLLAYLFKYPAFEFGARFAVGTRSSLIRGYQAVPGPRNWALFLFLATTVLQGFTILSGVMAITGSILTTAVGGLPYGGWMIALGLAVMVILRTGRYGALATGSKLMLALLVAGTLIAFVMAPPRAVDLRSAVVPTIPLGSVLLIASILGLSPTGINVSIWHSLWAIEHLPRWESGGRSRREVLRASAFDLGIGYWGSAVLAVMFMSLGATLLQPRGLVPQGLDVVLTISAIYTEILGPWMYPVFMATAFAVMFSTLYSVMDGFPRAFSTILKTLFPGSAFLGRPSNPTYWGFMAAIFTFAVAVNTIFPSPVVVVQLVGLLSLMLAPVLYSLNYYCVTRIAPEEVRPSGFLRAWALAGILFMAGAAAFYVYTQVGR